MKTTKQYAVVITSPDTGAFNFGETVEVDKTWRVNRLGSKKRYKFKVNSLQLCDTAYNYAESPRLINPKYV